MKYLFVLFILLCTLSAYPYSNTAQCENQLSEEDCLTQCVCFWVISSSQCTTNCRSDESCKSSQNTSCTILAFFVILSMCCFISALCFGCCLCISGAIAGCIVEGAPLCISWIRQYRGYASIHPFEL